VLKKNPSRSYSEDPELAEAVPLAQSKMAEKAEVSKQSLAEAM